MCNPVSTRNEERLLAKGVIDGYEWECVHNILGARCGYVRIPPGHPWHGVPWDALEDVAVHGGLTFSEPDVHCGRDGADDAWWLGFDCDHGFDLPDPDLAAEDLRPFAAERARMFGAFAEVRSTAYVERQCALLIAQAAAAAAGAQR